MVDAWNDYIRHHIVSKHALRLIRNFTLTQMPETVEADEDEEEAKAQTKLCEVATPWATVDTIASWLDDQDTGDFEVGTKHERTAAFTRHTTHRLWGLDDVEAPPCDFSKEGGVGVYVKADVAKKTSQSLRSTTARSGKHGIARLQYKGLTKGKADAWFTELCLFGSPKDKRRPKAKPNAEQQRMIKRVMERCLQEMADENGQAEFWSEPLTCVLHGVPGAGKSEVLQWLRIFFEDVCSWTHGMEFAYLTSQNSMAALIDGSTFHSFMGIPFMKEDGVVANKHDRRCGEHGMSDFFLRFERLR